MEGESDKTALGALIERLVKEEAVVFDVFHSDVFGATQRRAGTDPVMGMEKIQDRIRAVTPHVPKNQTAVWKR